MRRSLMKEGRLFRSARLDNATFEDRQKLVENYKINTVIDLRTKSEHVKQARRQQSAALKVPQLQSNAEAALPTQIPGLQYRQININGRAFARALLRQLSLWSRLKLFVLMIFNYRMAAISILGREVMQPRGLIGLGKDSLEYSGDAFRDLITTASGEENTPLLIHCTQGKDRTGISILLLLMLLGVSTEIITSDYLMSQEELEPEREERLKEIAEVGLSPDFADCDPKWAPEMVDCINDRWGGVRAYLRKIGVTEAEMERVVAIYGA
ncbi:MAG: hypothetical protein M1814_003233 [Vezdaea aestivalis]|nr:MAG: hypothetical protein M1814_003233 [Vezdaea aestivalis]